MTGWAWIDGGDIAPLDHARISVLDHGFTVGDGVYETFTTVGAVGFARTRHLARLRRSAELVGLAVPWTDEQLADAIDQVVARVLAEPVQGVAPRSARVRITVTSGGGPPGTRRAPGAATTIVAAVPAAAFAPVATVATVAWPRNERGAIVGVKSISQAEHVVAMAEAGRRGADEAILANTTGALCEGTGSNVFVVVGGELHTPSLATGCLAGITRGLVLELVAVVERDDLTIDDLRRAPEAFLTSATRGVHPIAVVDGTALGAAPGQRTAEAQAAYEHLRATTVDP